MANTAAASPWKNTTSVTWFLLFTVSVLLEQNTFSNMTLKYFVKNGQDLLSWKKDHLFSYAGIC